MRLGAYECELVKGSKSYEAYTSNASRQGGEKSAQLSSNSEALSIVGEKGEGLLTKERHRHRYEFNNAYKAEYEQAGMKCVGINPAADLVEIVEIPDKRWYIGTQFHPEYSSTVLHPHPLFISFIKACK